MTQSNRPPMAGSSIDRDAGTRRSEALLDAAWNEPSARVMHLRDGEVWVSRGADDELHLQFSRPQGERDSRHLYLGRIDGSPVFAEPEGDAGIETDIVDDESRHITDGEWVSPFTSAAELPAAEAEALAAAFALTAWHRSNGFSPRDGLTLTPTGGGWVRQDTHGEHFPRTDPVVIVRIEHDGRLLLGSNALWEPDRFSLLAGFIEAGESAEAAVEREVFEESGMRLGEIQYLASQPWPFPRSLMLGFRAQLAPGTDPLALTPDAEEISELRWFTRDELRAPSGLRLPRPLSIARWMIDAWIAEGDRD